MYQLPTVCRKRYIPTTYEVHFPQKLRLSARRVMSLSSFRVVIFA